MRKIGWPRVPKPASARRTQLAALKNLRARKAKIIAGMRTEKRLTKDSKREVFVRITTKRVSNRLGDLEEAALTVREMLESRRYKLGFRGLARLQRKHENDGTPGRGISSGIKA